MPPRDWRLRIGDIIKAADTIRSYVQDQSFQSFSANGMMIDAVVRNLEIIGEAARHVPPVIQTRYPVIPWIDMRAMRNATARGYFEVDLEVVWNTVQKDIPPLIPLLREILEKASSSR